MNRLEQKFHDLMLSYNPLIKWKKVDDNVRHVRKEAIYYYMENDVIISVISHGEFWGNDQGFLKIKYSLDRSNFHDFYFEKNKLSCHTRHDEITESLLYDHILTTINKLEWFELHYKIGNCKTILKNTNKNLLLNFSGLFFSSRPKSKKVITDKLTYCLINNSGERIIETQHYEIDLELFQKNVNKFMRGEFKGKGY